MKKLRNNNDKKDNRFDFINNGTKNKNHFATKNNNTKKDSITNKTYDNDKKNIIIIDIKLHPINMFIVPKKGENMEKEYGKLLHDNCDKENNITNDENLNAINNTSEKIDETRKKNM